MKKVSSGGGWPAIRYTLRKAREAGGIRKMYQAMRAKNACKTCALGMGGQRGRHGQRDRATFPEVCKKSLQAMAADMQGAIRRSSGAPTASRNCRRSRRASWNTAAG